MATKFNPNANKFSTQARSAFLLEKLEAVAPGEFVVDKHDPEKIVLRANKEVRVSLDCDYWSVKGVEVVWGRRFSSCSRELAEMGKKRSATYSIDKTTGGFDVQKVVDRAREGVKMLKEAQARLDAKDARQQTDEKKSVQNMRSFQKALKEAGVPRTNEYSSDSTSTWSQVDLSNGITVHVRARPSDIGVQSIHVPGGTPEQVANFVRQLATITTPKAE